MTALNQYLKVSYGRRKLKDRFACGMLGLAAIVALVPLFSVLGYVLLQGIPALNIDFFTQTPKPVGEVGGGMANALVGTSVLILLGSFIGVGWGLVVGIYLSEYGRGRLGTMIRFTADLLASIPSIVIGLFVYSIIVLPMKRFSALAGGVALGIIMIPTVARSTEELLRLVPTHIREAGLALGLPRWKVILRIVLRGCASGITTGIMLAVARVAGETAPLLFTALNNQFFSVDMNAPMPSLPVVIFQFALSPYEDWKTLAWAGALLITLTVLVINILARSVFRQTSVR